MRTLPHHPSYQPELRGYLTQLLADRERLAAALPQLAEWARADVAPTPQEIEAVRRLIVANDEVLAGLDADDRQAVETGIATVRSSRAALDATFPVQSAASPAKPDRPCSPPSNGPPKPTRRGFETAGAGGFMLPARSTRAGASRRAGPPAGRTAAIETTVLVPEARCLRRSTSAW